MAGETKLGKSQFRKWKTASGVIVCARAELSLPDSFIDRVLLTSSELEKVGASAGRGDVLRSQLPNGEQYVLRPYRRGGMIQHVNKESFLALPVGPLRPMLELEILSLLFDKGIPVARPLFALVQYGLLNLSYSCAIATSEIQGALNFLDARSRILPEVALSVSELAGVAAGRALVAGIFHRDLHPGNVLFRSPEEVFLIDFDNALRIGRENILRFSDRLSERWERGILKHGMDRGLCAAFSDGVKEGIGSSLKQEIVEGG